MKVKPHKALVVAIALVALVASACGSNDDDSVSANDSNDTTATTAAPAEKPTGAPIKIGAVLSVTGPASTLGDQEAKALRLRVEAVNAKGGVEGRPVELKIEDDQSDPNHAVDATRSLLQSFKPHAIVGGSVTATCYAMKPVTEEAKIVQFCLSGAPIPPAHPFYFSAMSPQPRWLGDLPVKFFTDSGYKSVACLATDDASGQQYIKTVEGAVKGANLTMAGTETYGVQDVDVTAQLTRIKSKKPDVVYSCTSGKPVVPALQGAQQLGLNVPFWLGSGSASLDVANLIKDMLPAAGVFTGGEKIQVFDQLANDDPQKKPITDFVTAYQKANNKRPDLFAAAAADAFDILTQSIAKLGGDPTGEQLVKHLEDDLNYTGIQLTYDFSPDNHRSAALSGIVLQFTKDGSFKLAKHYKDADIPGACAKGACP